LLRKSRFLLELSGTGRCRLTGCRAAISGAQYCHILLCTAEGEMIAVNGNSGLGTMVPRGLRKRRLLAGAAAALGFMAVTALPVLAPTPAAAQTFVIGGFRIHVHGLGGGGYYSRHRSSRHHAGTTNNRRHARHRGGEQEEETAAKTAPAPQVPVVAPVAEAPVTSTSRPLLHGPDIEPSK
jgi:hypothetical protein